MNLVYILSRSKKPLMPCKPAIARRLLAEKKAKVVSRTPFILKLLYGATEYKQEITGGLDTGSTHIGSAAISQGQVLYQAEVTLRQDVSGKMDQRRSYRRTKRSRKTRYRPARFDNRGKKGSVAPSLRSKLDSHHRERKAVESILPITQWRVELASFDIHKISNPSLSKKQGWTYQNGEQKGFYNLKAYVLHRDQYKCQQCGTQKGKLHVHHLIYKSQGGTDEPGNLITLCEKDHKALHAGELNNISEKLTKKITKKNKSKTKHATEMGILRSQLKKDWPSLIETFGYETKFKREQLLQVSKSHANDAIAICYDGSSDLKSWTQALLKKKHVSKGDYQQTCGKRSEKRVPTDKLFGFRKFDLVETPYGIGFMKGKRSTGYFAVAQLDGTKIHDSVNIRKSCRRLTARKTTLIQREGARLLHALKSMVSAAAD